MHPKNVVILAGDLISNYKEYRDTSVERNDYRRANDYTMFIKTLELVIELAERLHQHEQKENQ